MYEFINKFRVWVVESENEEISGKMYYSDNFVSLSHFFAFVESFPKDKVILMRFTGLVDKKKVNIYEADIMDNRRIIMWDMERSTFMSSFKGSFNHHISQGLMSHEEVTGNVYTQPDFVEHS